MQVRGILSVKGKVLFTIATDRTLAEAVAIMDTQDVGSLACFENGRMAGMLTFREVMRELNALGPHWGSVKVADAMVRNPVIGLPDMDVDDLRRLMVERHMRYLPIMEGETLLGIISFHDVARAILEEQGFENRMLRAYISDWPQGEVRP